MEWILHCFTDICDWVPGLDVHCKRLGENGKLIEFCGRSNKVGLFVASSVFYGGVERLCYDTSKSQLHWLVSNP